MNKKIVSIFAILLISLSFILAQGHITSVYGIQTETANKYTNQQMTQAAEMFQNKYNYCNENTECNLYENKNMLQFEVREQNRFLFFNVNSIATYEIDANGDVIQTKYNFWYRLTNRNSTGGI